ncbi:unnamed protein product [Blepharisma stoltei]|uniref:Tectonic-1-3 N-terminal domain-containing protein n=1 Tax=Blepharisma stoltei TaxID=1481888 RepID=A0AAU9IW71_9CILI|nr:unnamed protein product [Blepharisma stoltei]
MFAICTFLLAAYLSSADESNYIEDDTDPGKCVCDLTANSCDVFCCCDDDCSSTLKDLWDTEDPSTNRCLNSKFTKYYSLKCPSSNDNYFYSARRGIKSATSDIMNNLLCVDQDNSASFGTYYKKISDSSISSDTIQQQITDNVEYSDLLYSPQTTITRSNFNPGDLMGSLANSWAQFGNRWSLPSPDSFGYCNDMNFVKWLEPSSPGFCNRQYLASTLSTHCTSELNAALYSSLLQVYNTSNLASSSLYTIQIGSIKIRDVNTLIDTSSSSTSVSTTYSSCICTNALLEAHYTVLTTLSQQYFLKITADLVVGNIGTTGCSGTETINIQQKFSVTFQTQETVTVKSGNPGYIVGKPVLLGKLQSDNTINVYSSGYPVYGASLTGQCLTSSQTTSNPPVINFRQDFVYSCYYPLSYPALSSYCTTYNEKLPIFSIFDDITHVGKFGNSLSSNIDDWVEIKDASNKTVATSWNSETGDCLLPNMVVYDIVVAEIGSIKNPQPKIVYAQKRKEFTNWAFMKTITTDDQYFMNTVVINYIEYDKDFDPYTLIRLKSQILPDDVLYPFRASGSRVSISVIFGILAIILN